MSALVQSATQVLETATARYSGRICLTCSFGGPSGIVLIDLLHQIDVNVPVHYLDTDLLFPETHQLIDRIADRYGIIPVAVKPALTLSEQAAEFGEALWTTDPDICCAIRKLSPHQALMRGYDAWITGIRRDQTLTRAEIEIFELDKNTGTTKISPLAHWTEADVWAYVREHDLPVNALHERGYPSIGCIPCTRAVGPKEALRAGRWSDTGKTECGLHVQVTHGQ
jgi:phosphoadenosine phosphosulfate reductase